MKANINNEWQEKKLSLIIDGTISRKSYDEKLNSLLRKSIEDERKDVSELFHLISITIHQHEDKLIYREIGKLRMVDTNKFKSRFITGKMEIKMNELLQTM